MIGKIDVKNANLGPIFLILLDELQVIWHFLVAIMCRAIRKDNLQSNVKLRIVNGSVQILCSRPNAEEHNP